MPAIQIKNKYGQLLFEGKPPFMLDDLDLREAVMEGMILQGASFMRANLEGANLRGADLYGAHFFGTNLQRTPT